MDDAKLTVTCGIFIRPRMRALFDYNAIQWTEHKGFLRSHFVARGSDEQVRNCMATLTEWKRQLNS